MHAAAAPLRATGRAAEELGEQLARRHALGQGVPVPAMSAEDDVVAAQMRTHAGGDRLLPDVSMTGPVNQPALMRLRQLLFAAPDQDHGAIKGQELVVAQMGRSIGRMDCFCCHVSLTRGRSISFDPSEASDTNDFDEAVAFVNGEEDS